MKAVNYIALTLVIIGALNWGLWGFFQVDAVAAVFGGPSTVAARIVYALVGLAGLWSFRFYKHVCCCSSRCNVCHKECCTCHHDPLKKNGTNGQNGVK